MISDILDLLIQELSLPRKYYSTLSVDKGVKGDTNLKEIFKRNQSEKVQFFLVCFLVTILGFFVIFKLVILVLLTRMMGLFCVF